MTLLKPLPRAVTRPIALAILAIWVVTMTILIDRSYLQASHASLAIDVARYGPTAVWRGVYFRGEKIGFTVSQTARTDEGFDLQEEGRLQMLLFGQDSAAAISTRARVSPDFVLQSFEFSLDPGTGATEVRGHVEPPGADGGPHRLVLAFTASGATRTETRELRDPPVLMLTLFRRLARLGLTPGVRHELSVIDPATTREMPVVIDVGGRSVVRAGDTLVPAFRVDLQYQGLQTTAWVTDSGDVMREESPLGLMTVREPPERAQGLAVPGRVQEDILRLSAVVPEMRGRIDDPRDVLRLRMRLVGATLPPDDIDGGGQHVDGAVIAIEAPRLMTAGPADPDAGRYLQPEPFIESDAPEIVEEAQRVVEGLEGAHARAERLTRHVNAIIDKKPTVSLPSALDVLRTQVGDCNEHTVLYVALARSLGIPARVAVGLVFLHGAFYYHAWPEVYLTEDDGRGLWLPVDPTLNQFPADGTHLRLARGGLDRQAVILPLISRLRITVLDLELAPGAARVLVGRDDALPAEGAAVAAAAAAAMTANDEAECRCAGRRRHEGNTIE